MTAEIGRAFLRLIFFKNDSPQTAQFQIKDLGHVSCISAYVLIYSYYLVQASYT